MKLDPVLRQLFVFVPQRMFKVRGNKTFKLIFRERIHCCCHAENVCMGMVILDYSPYFPILQDFLNPKHNIFYEQDRKCLMMGNQKYIPQ